jgi:phage terminase large subunit-like protein
MAKNVLSAPLRNTCQSMGMYVNIEELNPRGEKESRIRRLIPLFRDWLVYFTRGIEDGQPASLEKQLLSFPRWKHDDLPDCLNMLYDMYTLQPNIERRHRPLQVSYKNGRPIMSK